jgi:phage terminase Nu1 subunit (DNA packaging protein)
MAQGSIRKVNRAELAEVFGVSLPTVDAWIRAGCPFDQRGTSGKPWIFDTADVLRWREERAAQEASGGDVQDEEALRLRKLKAETLVAELELAQKKALVAPLDQMERALTRAFAEVQCQLRGPLITRLVTQLIGETDQRKFKAVALAEVDSVLEILANLDVTADEDEVDDEEADVAAD